MFDFDRPGFCCKCHTEIAEFNGSDDKGRMIIKKLKGNAGLASFKLSDGSAMEIALCIQCKDTLQPEDATQIMDSVIKGWQYELDTQMNWDQSKKSTHMDKYSKLEIEDRQDLKWNEGELKRLNEVKVKR